MYHSPFLTHNTYLYLLFVSILLKRHCRHYAHARHKTQIIVKTRKECVLQNETDTSIEDGKNKKIFTCLTYTNKQNAVQKNIFFSNSIFRVSTTFFSLPIQVLSTFDETLYATVIIVISIKTVIKIKKDFVPFFILFDNEGQK